MPPKLSQSAVADLCLDDLGRSGLTREDARKLNLEILMPAEVAEICAPEVALGRPGYRIPYHAVDGSVIDEMWRVRLVGQPLSRGLEEPRRYTQPSGVRPYPYLPANVDWAEVRENPKMPIIFTEGEKKAAALAALGLPCVGLGGVWNFRSSKWLIAMLPEIEELGLEERPAYVAYDSDVRTKKGVRLALGRFMDELIERGAVGYDVAVPDLGDGKTGVDDFLVARGGGARAKKAFQKLMVEAEEYDAAEKLWEMNEQFAVIRSPGLVYEFETEEQYTANGFQSITYSNVHVERPDYRNPAKLVKVKAAKAWIEWPLRREYQKMVYEPGRAFDVDGNLNLWKGWAIEPVAGACDDWLDYVSYIVDDDEEAFGHLIKWLAYPLQNPGAKIANAVFIWSREQGTGKTFLGECMGLIYGQNYKAIGPKDFEQGFNAWALNRQFIMIDEAKGGDRRADAEIVKRMITREQIEINQKYLPQYWIRDSINYYITSNHPDALYLDAEDRRIFVWHKRGPRRPPEYFARLKKKLKAGMASHVFDYLMNVDLEGFDPQANAPATAAKDEVISISKSDLETWVDMLVESPEMVLGNSPCDFVTADDLLSNFHGAHEGSRITKTGLGRILASRGIVKKPVKVGSRPQVLYAVRNISEWDKAPHGAWLTHFRDNVLKNEGAGQGDDDSKKKY